MISIDTNLLFYAFREDVPFHHSAVSFIEAIADRPDVGISEFVLVELYRLLRNPVVVATPLTAADAVKVISVYRTHPHWKLIGLPNGGPENLHDKLWRIAAKEHFAYRRIYDARLALSLIDSGVTEFATVNVKDFEGFGFRRVWNPI